MRINRSLSRLVAAAVLFSLLTACHTGKGKLTFTLEPQSAVAGIDLILKTRLERMGIDGDNISVTKNGERYIVEITEISKYGPELKNSLTQLFSRGGVEFWETYTMAEAYPGLNAYLSRSGPGDSAVEAGTSARMKRFASLVEFADDPTGNSCALCYCKPADTARVNLVLDSMKASGFLPPRLKFAWSKPNKGAVNETSALVMLKSNREGKARMEYPQITQAETKVNKASVEIAFHFSGYDADAWKRMTRENIGKAVAIVINGKVYSYPTVNAEIPNGFAVITGDFSRQEADMLVALLNSDPLPVPIRIIDVKEE